MVNRAKALRLHAMPITPHANIGTIMHARDVIGRDGRRRRAATSRRDRYVVSHLSSSVPIELLNPRHEQSSIKRVSTWSSAAWFRPVDTADSE